MGSQCWLKENLNIGMRINGLQEQTDNTIIEKYCYNNDPAIVLYTAVYIIGPKQYNIKMVQQIQPHQVQHFMDMFRVSARQDGTFLIQVSIVF
jgi:hypothetical protein